MKQFTIFIFLASFLFGCGDFLEPKAKSEFVPKDAAAMNELLLGEAYPRYDRADLNIFLGLLDDDVDGAPYQKPKEGGGVNPDLWVAAFSWQPEMYEQMYEASNLNISTYRRFYELILGANAVLDYIEEINDKDLEMMNSVKAQALTLRAFYYLTLVNIFGTPYNYDKTAMGVPLKLNSGVELKDLARNSVEEVYSQVIADLQEAGRLYHLLPEAQQWEANYRTSLPMVHLLLSRTYLYMEEWENAAIYADSVMSNKNFQLLDLNSVADEDGRGIPVYMDYHTYQTSPETIFPYFNVGDCVNWLYNARSSEGEHPYFRASPKLLNTFESTDLRKTRYISRSNYIAPGEEGYMYQAFGKIAMRSGENYYQPLFNAVLTFGRSLRLSEAYLNYCEAKAMLAQQGNTAAQGEAIHVLEKLRVKRFAPENYHAANITGIENLIDFIREERRRELCFEDHRWFDLRRWGMPEIQHTWHPDENTRIVYTLKKNDPSYTVPLPSTALESNAYLHQNPLAEAPRVGDISTINN
ncbi:MULTISPECIES: RagB/SusD family nutrient uptake outer membrane protein [Butyricimonas]|uniref:RagB/SusD family nutrient uptake outer membrane protein n=1 Tax=Butyricimonas TaxID=574697 RepID=UPI0007FB3887|nr:MULTISPECIES: RagB/SusD family nutrient uptake outer membrane protein [Butyricimonas]